MNDAKNQDRVSDVVREVWAGAVELLHAEMALLRGELSGTARRFGLAAALLAFAFFAAVLDLVLFSGALATGLGALFGAAWLGWLVTAGAILIFFVGAPVGIAVLLIVRATSRAKAVTRDVSSLWRKED